MKGKGFINSSVIELGFWIGEVWNHSSYFFKLGLKIQFPFNFWPSNVHVHIHVYSSYHFQLNVIKTCSWKQGVIMHTSKEVWDLKFNKKNRVLLNKWNLFYLRDYKINKYIILNFFNLCYTTLKSHDFSVPLQALLQTLSLILKN